MKSDKKILIAFCLNLFFSLAEFIGGAITGSIAIISDSIHDLGDSCSIGTSYIFEKLSHKKPDEKHTYGYYRYSVLGSVIQSVILLLGSMLVLYNAVLRLINPVEINYGGMIIFAIFGFIVNFIAAYFTSGGESLNQKAINLHMLEDVFGWAIVLIGAVVMHFTDWAFLDSILSIALAFFIIFNAFKCLKAVLDIFLEKTPKGINADEIKSHLLEIDGVKDIHHLHIWSMDGYKSSATLHAVTDADFYTVKQKIKAELIEHGISHSTVECERTNEVCGDECCSIELDHGTHHHHNDCS